MCAGGSLSIEGKKEFSKVFGMAKQSVTNAIVKLIKRGFLIDGKHSPSLHKQLHIEFDILLLQIQIENDA